MIKRVRTGARLPERIAALGGKSMSLVMPELNRKVLSRRNDIRCGTTIENYGFMLRADAKYATKAARVSALARDNSELLQDGALPAGDGHRLIVAYHAACSLQHRQQITAPVKLLLAAGFVARTPAEAHLCCGSAGTYNILRPQIAGRPHAAGPFFPLDNEGVPLGAVGISGDISDNDEICALAGSAAARLTAQGH